MNKSKTYVVDPTMAEAITQMQKFLGLKESGEVIRRSIALMKLAIDSADKDKKILLGNDKTGDMQRVSLVSP